jgi:hypothetical protein
MLGNQWHDVVYETAGCTYSIQLSLTVLLQTGAYSALLPGGGAKFELKSWVIIKKFVHKRQCTDY